MEGLRRKFKRVWKSFFSHQISKNFWGFDDRKKTVKSHVVWPLENGDGKPPDRWLEKKSQPKNHQNLDPNIPKFWKFFPNLTQKTQKSQKSQEIPTQTKPKSPKPSPKITKILTTKSQKPEIFSQKNPKFPIFGLGFLGIFGSSLGKIFRILGYLGLGFGDFWVLFGLAFLGIWVSQANPKPTFFLGTNVCCQH